MGASAYGAMEDRSVHGGVVVALVMASFEVELLNQFVTVVKREEGSPSGEAVMSASRSGWCEVGQII